LQKQLRQIASTVEVKIHRQKCEIVGDINETKPVVKLDAIEDGGCFRSEMDVIEVQIAVAIENPMLLNPIAK